MTQSSTLSRACLALSFLLATMLYGCPIGHRVPIGIHFQFALGAPAGTSARAIFFADHRETNPSTGVTDFITKAQPPEVSAPSGDPSMFRRDAFASPYQGGLWQGRARVWVRSAGGDEIYVGEGVQQFTLPYEVPPAAITRPIQFGITPVPTSENISGFRITVIQ
jgi:hypothetical protein